MKLDWEYYIPHDNDKNRERLKYLLRNSEKFKLFKKSSLYGHFYKVLKQVPEKFLTLFDKIEIKEKNTLIASYVTVNLYGVKGIRLAFGVTNSVLSVSSYLTDAPSDSKEKLSYYVEYIFPENKSEKDPSRTICWLTKNRLIKSIKKVNTKEAEIVATLLENKDISEFKKVKLKTVLTYNLEKLSDATYDLIYGK